MNPIAKGNVTIQAAGKIQLLRVRELALIVIGRCQLHEKKVSLRDVLSTEFDIFGGKAWNAA